MNPRKQMTGRFLVIVLLAASRALAEPADDGPLVLPRGPHLFVDDHLIAASEGVERKVIPPQRFLN